MATKTTNLGMTKFDGGDYIDYNKINEAFDILDKLGVDYVTSSGTTNQWTWRKYKSGVAECWGKLDQGVVEPVGSPYWKNFGITFPFTFSEIPTVNANVGATSSVETQVMYVNSTTTGIDMWIKKSDPNSRRIWIYVHAIGKV